jgi:hypothetical protein
LTNAVIRCAVWTMPKVLPSLEEHSHEALAVWCMRTL